MPRKYPEGKPTHSYQINTVGPNETFNEILSKAIIVTGFQQATANVEAPDPNLNYGYYKLFQMLSKGWISNLPKFAVLAVAVAAVRRGRSISPLATSAITLLSLPSLLLFRIFQRLYLWSPDGYEWKSTSNVKNELFYQDPTLLNQAWQRAQKVGWISIPNDDPKDVVMFQPRSGFCGVASLNSTLRSLKHSFSDPFLQLHRKGRYLELEQAHNLLCKLLNSKTWNTNYEAIETCEIVGGGKSGMTYDTFLSTLKLINHPTRPAKILSIYVRSPMFFCDGSFSKKFNSFMSGHWSPLPAYLSKSDQCPDGLVLVMDVNRTYGGKGYLVKPRRLYEACNTVCCMTGLYRGLIVLRPPKRMLQCKI